MPSVRFERSREAGYAHGAGFSTALETDGSGGVEAITRSPAITVSDAAATGTSPQSRAGRTIARPAREAQGIRTVSMTWMTPFDWRTLGMVIRAVPPLASVITYRLPMRLNDSGSPLTVA